MSTIPHPIAPEEIMAHLDGELSAARSQSVSAHLESCATCSALEASLRTSSKSLSNWRVAPVPSGLQDGVLAASRRAPHVFRGLNLLTLFAPGSWFRKRWVLAVSVAGCALMFLFLILARDGGPYQSAIYRSKEIRSLSIPQTPSGRGDSLRSVSRDGQAMQDADASTEWSVTEPSKNTAGAATAQRAVPLAEFNRLQLFSKLQRPTEPQGSAPMIARTVSLSIIAKDFDSAHASLDVILARHNGYAADLSVATPLDAARSLQASLRIPAPQLAAALTELKSLGRVELETQNGEEVTQQHTDLVARLKNSRETEQRLQGILTERTGKISDVLEVEQEIARVRGEIEQMEAEQKNLEHRVDFATIDLKLSEEYKAKLDSPAPAISTLIHNAAVNGYRNVADTLLSIILFLAEFGPVLAFWLLLLALPATLVWRRWRHAIAN